MSADRMREPGQERPLAERSAREQLLARFTGNAQDLFKPTEPEQPKVDYTGRIIPTAAQVIRGLNEARQEARRESLRSNPYPSIPKISNNRKDKRHHRNQEGRRPHRH